MRLIIYANDVGMALESVRAAHVARANEKYNIVGVRINGRTYGVRRNESGSVTVWPNDYDHEQEKGPVALGAFPALD